MGRQMCFSSSRWKWRFDILLKYLQSRFFYSQVEILCRLILRVKKVWRCSSFSSVSSLARYVVVECGEKNVRSFRCLGKAFSFFMAARFVYFDFFYVAIEVAHIPTLILFTLPKPRRKSVILVLRKVTDVFKLNDEKRSHFLIDEIFQVAMFLQWNLIVDHPKIF